ncbi:MAG: starch-binding protein [Muribaculaceae bacterium]|nr:starch-binding protein [Muribaculaceae bacterium]
MKKTNILSILFLLLLPVLAGCTKDEIIFDSELPQFDLRPGYQLLEVIVPQGTASSDKIYITGPFNGGQEAVGNPMWQLEKARDTDVKWGIYLNPADFVDGKTLADGYTFYNAEQGEERSLTNTEVVHTDAPALGGRLNVLVYRWADYFNKPQAPDEIVHDGYVIYVVDNSGFEELAMYAWGDAEAFGGWPGMKATGKVEIDGVTYKYFDTGAANEGLSLNLIFNDNGAGKQLPDFSVTLDQDFYLELTPDMVIEYDPAANVQHDGYAVFVADFSGWDALYLYMWGDINDLNGAWPGMEPTGTQVINGVTYTYFDLGEANCNAGPEEHVILNNGSGKQFDDVVVFNLDRDVYLELTAKGATEIDPETYVPADTPEQPEEPAEPEEPATECKLYFEDNTGWDALYVYAWGEKEVFGGWPGEEAVAVETVDGVNYKVLSVQGRGESVNLIFHNNAGMQYDALSIVLDKNYFIIANPDNAELK